jgi:hypothetical protein
MGALEIARIVSRPGGGHTTRETWDPIEAVWVAAGSTPSRSTWNTHDSDPKTDQDYQPQERSVCNQYAWGWSPTALFLLAAGGR